MKGLGYAERSWARAWGMADVATDRPMDTNTMLLAGSISKPVAAVRALQLAEQASEFRIELLAFSPIRKIGHFLTAYLVAQDLRPAGVLPGPVYGYRTQQATTTSLCQLARPPDIDRHRHQQGFHAQDL